MLGKVTTLATLEAQAVDSQVELRASTGYLINTLNIAEMKVEGATDSWIHYKFSLNEDRSPEFILTVNETNAAIQTLADATLNSQKVILNVFENIESFNQASTETAVAWSFNVNDIIWGEEDGTAAYTRMWYAIGGKQAKAVIVDHSIAQIVGWADEGTTAA